MAVSDWNTNAVLNTSIGEYSLSGPYGRIFAELMAQIKASVDATDADIEAFDESLAGYVKIKQPSETGAASVYGGKDETHSAAIALAGGSHSQIPGYFRILARTSSDASKRLEGKPNGTLLWDGQTIQTSSDERLKTPLSTMPDAVLDAWEDVSWGEFKFLDAVAEKGANARLHLGLIAQRVKAVFESHGLDACDYGILCHEEREASGDEPAVDLWMVRYTEALAMEAACQRRRASRLEARIAALEARLGID